MIGRNPQRRFSLRNGTGGGRCSVVNPFTALDYAASGLMVRRFSIAVPFVSLIRPLHRPSSALVQAFSEHLQAVPETGHLS